MARHNWCQELMQIDEEFWCDVLRNILGEDEEYDPSDAAETRMSNNPLDTIDAILQEDPGKWTPANDSREPICNTYPVGVPTDKNYPRFLAICRNSGLKKAFDAIKAQSKLIAQAYPTQSGNSQSGNSQNGNSQLGNSQPGNSQPVYPTHVDRTVILLTDQWSPRTFSHYEKTLLNHASKDGIWYIFILVTDYGCTEIPFLPHDRGNLSIFLERSRKRSKDKADELEAMEFLRRSDPVHYCIHPSTWQYGTDRGLGASYILDFQNRRWMSDDFWFKDSSPEWHPITESAFRRFAKAVAWVRYADGLKFDYYRTLDAESYSLDLYGKTLIWDEACAGFPESRKMRVIRRALDNIVGRGQ